MRILSRNSMIRLQLEIMQAPISDIITQQILRQVQENRAINEQTHQVTFFIRFLVPVSYV